MIMTLSIDLQKADVSDAKTLLSTFWTVGRNKFLTVTGGGDQANSVAGDHQFLVGRNDANVEREPSRLIVPSLPSMVAAFRSSSSRYRANPYRCRSPSVSEPNFRRCRPKIRPNRRRSSRRDRRQCIFGRDSRRCRSRGVRGGRLIRQIRQAARAYHLSARKCRAGPTPCSVSNRPARRRDPLFGR